MLTTEFQSEPTGKDCQHRDLLDLLQLGGTPNDMFLEAPKPKPYADKAFEKLELVDIQNPEPDQQFFYSDHSG